MSSQVNGQWLKLSGFEHCTSQVVNIDDNAFLKRISEAFGQFVQAFPLAYAGSYQ